MKNIIIIIGLILLSSCGFKVVNNDQFDKYYITQIDTKGDSKINYRIKNKITTSSNIANKIPVVINLDTKKEKLIKEKNIRNEITKYQIKINVKADIKLLDSTELKNFKVTRFGDYSVTTRYTNTRNNESRLIRNLANNLAEDIKKELNLALK